MNLLFCAATEAEIAPLRTFLTGQATALSAGHFRYKSLQVDLLITGVGGVATAYALGKALQQNKPDLVVQAGIAGAFSPDVPLGSVWRVSEEHFADLGAEDGTGFRDLFDLQLQGANQEPFAHCRLPAGPLPEISVLPLLPAIPAISVNRVSGARETIDDRIARYGMGLESMEGAAFFYVCRLEGVPFMEVRSVSNQVEVRDTRRWKLGLAITALNDTLIRFLEESARPKK